MPYDRNNFTKLSPFSSFDAVKRMALRGQVPSIAKGPIPHDYGTWDLWTLELSNDLARLGIERTIAAKAVHGATRTLRAIAIELDAQPHLTRHFVLASYEGGGVVGLAGLLSGIVDYLHLPNSRGDFQIKDGDDLFAVVAVNVTAALARIRRRARKHQITLDPLADRIGAIPGSAAPATARRATRSPASPAAARSRRVAKRPPRRRQA
jgi:hypothetical protein